MNKKNNYKKGFSLIEIMLSVSMIAVFVIIFITAIIDSQEANLLTGKRNIATRLSEEGIEALRNIRDDSFSNLVDGNYGLTIIDNKWSLVPASDVTNNEYTRSIVISTINPKMKQVKSTITWSQNAQRDGRISLVTNLIDMTNQGTTTGTTTP